MDRVTLNRVFEFKLTMSYSGKKEHSLIYESKYGDTAIAKEVSTKITHGKPGKVTVLYYDPMQKETFTELHDLIEFLNRKRGNKSG